MGSFKALVLWLLLFMCVAYTLHSLGRAVLPRGVYDYVTACHDSRVCTD